MVTFYRKAQIKGNTSSAITQIDLPGNQKPSRWDEPKYTSMLDPQDDLPYVVVRPRVSRKTNGKKVMRMRSYWD